MNWKALYYMVLSTLSFTAMSTTIKFLPDFHSFQLVFFRCLVTMLICIAWLKSKRISFRPNQPTLLIGRALVGVTSMVLFFYGLKIMPFGTVVTLRYLAPVFAALFAIMFLRERIKPIQWFYILMAFGGVLLIKGFESAVSTYGLIIILSSAVFSGMVYVFLRAIGNRDHALIIVFYFMLIACVLSGIGSIFVWSQPGLLEWLLILSLGVYGYGGQIFMTKAFQTEEASKVAPLKYVESVFALMVGWLMFHETYTILGILGILLVISGMLLNMMVKKST